MAKWLCVYSFRAKDGYQFEYGDIYSSEDLLKHDASAECFTRLDHIDFDAGSVEKIYESAVEENWARTHWCPHGYRPSPTCPFYGIRCRDGCRKGPKPKYQKRLKGSTNMRVLDQIDRIQRRLPEARAEIFIEALGLRDKIRR